MHHYITKYTDVTTGKRYAESWLQINLFGYALTLWSKKIPLDK